MNSSTTSPIEELLKMIQGLPSMNSFRQIRLYCYHPKLRHQNTYPTSLIDQYMGNNLLLKKHKSDCK